MASGAVTGHRPHCRNLNGLLPSDVDFRPVTQAIPIAIGIEWVSASGGFIAIAEAIAVSVTAWVERIRIEVVIDAITIGIDVVGVGAVITSTPSLTVSPHCRH